MKYTKNRNPEARRRLLGAVLLALVAGLGFASCSELVDSDDGQQAKAPETNVKNYYYKIETKGVQYRYDLNWKNPYASPVNDVLIMNMQGYGNSYETWNGVRVCICDWTYEQKPGSEPWYYAMSQDSIVALDVENAQGEYTNSWV